MEAKTVTPYVPAIVYPTQDLVRQAVAAAPDESLNVLFSLNKQSLASAMRSIGLSTAIVTYGGDAKERVSEVELQPRGAYAANSIKAIAADVRLRWDETQRRHSRDVVFEEVFLHDLVLSLSDAAIELCGHASGEGCGTFTVLAADGGARLEHTDYFSGSQDADRL